MADSNLELMRSYMDLMVAGDFQAAMDYFADDIVAHQSGQNPWSGVYRGKAEWGEALAKITGSVDSFRIEEHDLLASGDHAVVLAKVSFELGGKTYEGNRVVVYHIAGDKITELWVIDEDQQALDDFLS